MVAQAEVKVSGGWLEQAFISCRHCGCRRSWPSLTCWLCDVCLRMQWRRHHKSEWWIEGRFIALQSFLVSTAPYDLIWSCYCRCYCFNHQNVCEFQPDCADYFLTLLKNVASPGVFGVRTSWESCSFITSLQFRKGVLKMECFFLAPHWIWAGWVKRPLRIVPLKVLFIKM